MLYHVGNCISLCQYGEGFLLVIFIKKFETIEFFQFTFYENKRTIAHTCTMLLYTSMVMKTFGLQGYLKS
jgi:hypothetical protein